MSLLIALVALIVAGMSFLTVTAISKHVNELKIEIDALRRMKGVADEQAWIATVRQKGKRTPTSIKLTASSEGDAMRQLLARKIDYTTVVSLVKKEGE